MPLNPGAEDFIPEQSSSFGLASNLAGSSLPVPPISESASAPTQITNRKLKYNIYKDMRNAIVHTTVRAGYDSAKLAASYHDKIYDENVKDKLIVNFVRMLAGLGWSTSTVLRATVLLESDPRLDALKCLQQAQKMGEDFRKRRSSSQHVAGSDDEETASVYIQVDDE